MYFNEENRLWTKKKAEVLREERYSEQWFKLDLKIEKEDF
jgi:hypothetical protein